MPISFTYDSTSTLYDIHHLDMNISVTLTELDTIATAEFVNEELIESIIVITVLKNVSMNGTELECSIADLGSDSAVLFVNTSGMTVTTVKSVLTRRRKVVGLNDTHVLRMICLVIVFPIF